MPLQIRRGTTAERTSIRPVIGELIYDTQLKQVYVGDSTDGGVTGTLGGNTVSTFGIEDAQDAIRDLFNAGTHTGISFSYDDAANKINATVGGGVVVLDIKGSVFTDDTSTILVDAVLGAINLDNTIRSNVIPFVNSTYDLGSPSKRFKDLYLSGSSLYVGNAVITATGSAINLPAGSTVGGVAIGSGGGGFGDGVIEGSTYKINIAASDSSIMLNTDNETVNASGGFFGNVTGNLTGNSTGIHKGNILANDDAEAFNATSKTFTGNLNGNVAGTINVTNTNGLTTVYYPIFVENRSTAQTLRGDVDLSYRTDSNTLTAGNFAGNLTGSVTGNIFTNLIDSADSSAITVTPAAVFSSDVTVENELNAKAINVVGTIIVGDNSERIRMLGRSDGPVIQSLNEELVLESAASIGPQVRLNLKSAATTAGSILTGLGSSQQLDLRSYKNGATAANPGDIVAGDILGSISFTGYMSSTTSAISCAMGVQADPNGTLTSTHIPSKFFFLSQANTSGGGFKFMTFDSQGRLAVNQETATATLDVNGFAKLAVLTSAPASPANGMVAIADGSGWDPAGTGKSVMVVYLAGGWRTAATAP